ncbi:plc-like phosphodiesterase [Fusarium subglutinans]|uniref:Plc-like phosphodiesterase n=1 Tax=Gibberella subglutinans TaxID=42677 RepID=A0A8H5NX53_GIBSU|nr:plc-like phosphodiesterase [Fusarium subglutinans]KAF5578905.1 plc-like phosphodiesterase [Fusarium subglutinans]
MLHRFLLYVSLLTSFTVAAPPTELDTHSIDAGSGSNVGTAGNHVLERLERRCDKVGSYFLLVNATPWKMTLSRNVSYQMNQFKFPKTIKPGTSNRIYIQGKGHKDDAGEASYKFKDLPGDPDFEFKYKSETAGIRFTKLKTLNNKRGSFHKLAWHWDNNVPFIIASSENDPKNPSLWPWLVSSNPPEDWMHSIYPRIACLTLRELAIPGTHNSGMSWFHRRSFFGTPANAQNQKLHIPEQLKNGARWLDLRPSKTGGKWATGHFSFGWGNWHGGNGEYLDKIIADVNAFTKSNKELIIINVSHGLNSDTFKGKKNARMTQREWNEVMTKLEKLNYRVENRSYVRDLTKLRVSQLIPGRAAVIIIIDDVIDKKYYNGSQESIKLAPVDVSAFAKKGFFQRSQFPLVDHYAETKPQKKMAADQLTKMKKHRKSPKSKIFLLSWILTQRMKPLIHNAEMANRALIELLWPAMSASTYPNIISVDAYPDNRDLAALAMAINYHFAPLCDIHTPSAGQDGYGESFERRPKLIGSDALPWLNDTYSR